jgi:hypothetical protein
VTLLGRRFILLYMIPAWEHQMRWMVSIGGFPVPVPVFLVTSRVHNLQIRLEFSGLLVLLSFCHASSPASTSFNV